MADGSTRLRPPGAATTARLRAACIRCARCVEACPYGSISLASIVSGRDYGTPFIDPDRSPCYLCMRCPTACPTDALDPVEPRAVAMGTADLDTATCLTWQHTLCNLCYKSCPLKDEAIKLDGRLRPSIDPEVCVGCGVCHHVCPSAPRSIVLLPRGNR